MNMALYLHQKYHSNQLLLHNNGMFPTCQLVLDVHIVTLLPQQGQFDLHQIVLYYRMLALMKK